MSLVMMVLILISIGLLRKVDPEGEGGGCGEAIASKPAPRAF